MKLITGFLMTVAFAWQAAAQTGGGPDDALPDEELEEFQELLKILDEETTVATKTRLNSDYVPGMVTVLQGEDLEALGIATVWEALSLVPGIPKEKQASIFEPFQQEQEGMRQGGTGLGLAISLRHIQMMGGEIELESSPGAGARFTFTLTGSSLFHVGNHKNPNQSSCRVRGGS